MNIDKLISAIPSSTQVKRAQMRANANTWLTTGTTSQRDLAHQLINALDAREALEGQGLKAELTSLNLAERVVKAFVAQPMTANERALIKVLLDNPDSTSSKLTRLMGWKAQSWHLHFGTMCANRAPYLWPAPDAEHRDGKFYSGILADLQEPANTFTMKTEVAVAFAQLGVR
jgi:hypothetical protein